MDKNRLLMIGILLIAFIGISVAISFDGIIPFQELNSNKIYLDQSYDYNGVLYVMTSIYDLGIDEKYCVKTTNFGSKDICLNGNISNKRYADVAFESNVKTLLFVDFDYNALELEERIESILFTDCINRGECEPLPIVQEPSLQERIIILEKEIKVLKQELCVYNNKYSWCK